MSAICNEDDGVNMTMKNYRLPRREVVLYHFSTKEIEIPSKTRNEAEGAGRLNIRKVICRRYGLKTMFIAVVAEPNENQQFDSKIYLKQIAEDRTLARTTYRNNFHHHCHINDTLKWGEW